MNKRGLLLITVFLLCSCGINEERKIPLFKSPATEQTIQDEKQYLVNKLYEDDFDHMIEKKMSFPIFVYAAGCGTCDNFAIVMKDYIRLHQVVFPYMTLAVFNQTKTKTPSLSESAILFYMDGTLKRTVDNVLDTIFSTKDLEKLMKEETYETGIEYSSSSYTYLNSTIPFYSFHFVPTISFPEEREKEIPRSYSESFRDGSSLLMRKEPNSYRSLYSFLDQHSIRSVFYSEEEEDTLEEIFGQKLAGDFISMTFENGSCKAAEPVTIL